MSVNKPTGLVARGVLTSALSQVLKIEESKIAFSDTVKSLTGVEAIHDERSAMTWLIPNLAGQVLVSFLPPLLTTSSGTINIADYNVERGNYQPRPQYSFEKGFTLEHGLEVVNYEGAMYRYLGNDTPVTFQPTASPGQEWVPINLGEGDVRRWGAYGIGDDTVSLNAANRACFDRGVQVKPLKEHTISGTISIYPGQDYSDTTVKISNFPLQTPACLIPQDVEEVGQLTIPLTKGVLKHPEMAEPNTLYFVVSTQLYVNRFDLNVLTPIYREEVLITNSAGEFIAPPNLNINNGTITKKPILDRATVKLPSVDTSGLLSKLYTPYRVSRPNIDVYCGTVTGGADSVYCLIEARQVGMVDFYNLYTDMASPNYTSNHWRVSHIRHFNMRSIGKGGGAAATGAGSGANGNVGREVEWHNSTIPNLYWHTNIFNYRAYKCKFTTNAIATHAAQGHGGGMLELYDCEVDWTRDATNGVISTSSGYGGGWDGTFKVRNLTINLLSAGTDMRLVTMNMVSSLAVGAVSKMPNVDVSGVKINDKFGTTSDLRPLRIVQSQNGNEVLDWSQINMPKDILFEDIDAGDMQIVPMIVTPDTIGGNTAIGKVINFSLSNIICNNKYTADEYVSFSTPNTSVGNIGWNFTFHNAGALYPRLLTMKSVTMTFSGEKTIFCGVKIQVTSSDTSSMTGTNLYLNSCKIYRGRWEEYSNAASITQARDGRMRASIFNCELLSPFSISGGSSSKLCGMVVALTNRSYANYAELGKVTVSGVVVEGTARQLIQDYKIGVYATA